MLGSRARLLLLHSDRLFRERLSRACAGRFEILLAENWEALRHSVRDAPPASPVLVDPYEGDHGGGLAPGLRQLLMDFPSMSILAACEVRRGAYDDLRQMGEWGISRVICLDEEDTPLAIRSVMEQTRGRPLQVMLRRVLPPGTSGRALAILMAAADVSTTGGGAKELARSLYVTPRTMTRWCQRFGLPVPRRLLAWMRILLAAELLDDPGRTVMEVALACGYSSDNALRNALRNFLDRSPRQLRDVGAFHAVADAFEREMVAARVLRRTMRREKRA